LDAFASEYATQIEHKYVDNRPLADEISDALRRTMREESFEEAGAARPFA